MAQLDETTFDPARGKPRIEIIFGHAHVGNYRVFLWDSQGKNPKKLKDGDNTDSVIDAFDVDHDPADLAERIVSFEAIVQAAEAKPGQIYSVTITMRQQGEVCPGGVVQESGAFEDVKALAKFRRFKTP